MDVGTYRGRALRAELSESSKKGTPQVVVTIEAVDTGETIEHPMYLTAAALQYAVRDLRKMGWRGDDLSDLSTVGSKEFEIVVEEEEYEGNFYARVKYINDIGGGPRLGKPMSDAQKKAFAARMRGAVIAASGGKAAPAPQRTSVSAPAGPSEPSPFPEEDPLPF